MVHFPHRYGLPLLYPKGWICWSGWLADIQLVQPPKCLLYCCTNYFISRLSPFLHALSSFLRIFFFWCGSFLKSLLNLLQYCFCFTFCSFFFLVCEACGLLAHMLTRDQLTSLTRNWICTPCFGRWSLNHWTTREVPMLFPALKITSIVGSAFSNRGILQDSVKDSDPSWRFFYLLHLTLNVSHWKSHWYWNQRETT